MNQSKIAVRYAKALFLTASEGSQLETVFSDMTIILLASKEVEQFSLYLKSPVVKPSQKKSLITSVFKDAVSDLTLNFLRVLIENKRESDLEGIGRWFIHLYREKKGIVSASITSAIALENSTQGKLNEILSQIYKTDVLLETNLDPSLIGGFILRVDDQQFDASVSTGLKRMKTALLSESK